MRYLTFIIPILLLSCSLEYEPVIPQFSDAESLLDDVPVLDTSRGKMMNGVYHVRVGKGEFGDSVVLHFTRGGPSIFCEKNGAFMIMESGIRGDTVALEGYWRYAYGRETGRVRFVVPPEEGGASIAQGLQPEVLVLRGRTGGVTGLLERPVELAFGRPLRQRAESFLVIGHRGGARNSDLHPVSENSLPMLRFAERIGCNAVEIDIRLTADRVPVLFHDETISNRLVQGDFLVGPISAYTWSQLRRYARLVNGEQIPLFDDALKTIVEETGIGFVWLDVKSPDVIDGILPIVDKYRKRARQLGRNVDFLIGLPSDDIYDALDRIPAPDRPPSLCELDPSRASAINASVWGPRWTLGIQSTEVARMHAEGRRVVSWTIDTQDILAQFLREGDFDGIVTNYPTVVVAMQELKGK